MICMLSRREETHDFVYQFRIGMICWATSSKKFHHVVHTERTRHKKIGDVYDTRNEPYVAVAYAVTLGNDFAFFLVSRIASRRAFPSGMSDIWLYTCYKGNILYENKSQMSGPRHLPQVHLSNHRQYLLHHCPRQFLLCLRLHPKLRGRPVCLCRSCWHRPMSAQVVQAKLWVCLWGVIAIS